MDTYYPQPHYREDSLVNTATGAGVAKYDPSQSWEVSWQNIRSLNRYQQSALCNIGLIRKIVYTLPKASCRKWGTVTLDGGDPDTVNKLNQALLNIPVIDAKGQRHGGGFKKAIQLALGLAFKTSNSAVILDADDGRSLYEPLDLKNLKKIKSLRVASKWHVTPYTYDRSEPSYTHYQIFGQGYYNLGDTFSISGTKIHRSRVFWFTGVEEDDEFIGNRTSLSGTDRSILDLIIDAFLEYYGGIKGAGRMIADFDVIVHKIKGLAEMVQADCESSTGNAQALVSATAARNAKTRSMFRGYLADMDQETIEHVTRQTGGYNDLLNTLKTYLQANTPYPPAVLFGEFSAGLTASGEGQEERALWNETVSELQEDKITPNLISLDPEFVGILGVVMAQQEGPTKGKILDNVGWQWHSLYDPTPQQQAALEKERAMLVQTYAALDPRFTANAILSHYGGQEFNPIITLTDEYKAALEAEARLEKEPPGGEGDEPAEEDGTALNEADGGTEDDIDLSDFAEFIDFDDGKTDSADWATDELFPHMDARRKSKLEVGDTRSKNGKTYVFNENRRWALKREGKATKPKKSRKASATKKKGPKPGDTKQSKSGRTLVFNGETRRWRLQQKDVAAVREEMKQAIKTKGRKLTREEAKQIITEGLESVTGKAAEESNPSPKSSSKSSNQYAGYKPMMSKAEADEYAKDSVFKEPLYHGTGKSAADSITGNGADPGANQYAIYGKGFYMAGTFEAAQDYASEKESPEVISFRVVAKNPIEFDDYPALVKFKQSLGLDPFDNSPEIAEKMTAEMKKRGYDSLRVKDKNYIVAFDKEQVVSFKRDQVDAEDDFF